MKHTEHEYIDTGYRYEKAQSADKAHGIALQLRFMLESEDPKDKPLARELIEVTASISHRLGYQPLPLARRA